MEIFNSPAEHKRSIRYCNIIAILSNRNRFLGFGGIAPPSSYEIYRRNLNLMSPELREGFRELLDDTTDLSDSTKKGDQSYISTVLTEHFKGASNVPYLASKKDIRELPNIAPNPKYSGAW